MLLPQIFPSRPQIACRTVIILWAVWPHFGLLRWQFGYESVALFWLFSRILRVYVRSVTVYDHITHDPMGDVKGPSPNVTYKYGNSCRSWCGADPAKLMLWMVRVSLGFLERKRLLGGNCGGVVLWGSFLRDLRCQHSQRERCSGWVHRWPTGLRVELQGGNDLSMSRTVINIFIIAISVGSMFCLSLKAEFTLWFILVSSKFFMHTKTGPFYFFFFTTASLTFENILARTVFIKTLAFLNTCAKGT